MKRFLPLLVGVFLAVVGFVILSVGKSTTPVVVAIADLPAGHVITEDDVTLQPMSNPPEDAFTDVSDAVGQTLAVARVSGDVITTSVVGGLPDFSRQLAPDERAIAVKVSLSSGIAGLLQPGDHVGVTMILNQGMYAKAVIEGVRVLWLSPEFQAQSSSAADATDDELLVVKRQAKEGVVVLAVPITTQAVIYDFKELGLEPERRTVNAVELLSALDQGSTNVALSLYLVPPGAKKMDTAGLFLPDLAVTPGPTPTPTPTAIPAP